MKNKSCIIFLYLFGIDGILGLVRGLLTSLGVEFFLHPISQLLCGVFTFVIIFYSIAIITIGFIRELRWSIRILGFYVISYVVLTAIISFFRGYYLGLQGVSPSDAQYQWLRSSFLNIYALAIGFIQIVLFFWALKDLSKGHFLSRE